MLFFFIGFRCSGPAKHCYIFSHPNTDVAKPLNDCSDMVCFGNHDGNFSDKRDEISEMV